MGRLLDTLSPPDRVTVPGHLLSPRGGDHYVLRVVGNALEDEGMYEGDFVIVLRRTAAELGETVLVLLGDEATIKRYYPEADGRVRLQSRKKDVPPLLLKAEEARIQGVVVGLMRKL